MPTKEVKDEIEEIKKTYRKNEGGFFSTREIFNEAESVKAVFLKLVEHALVHHLNEGGLFGTFNPTARPAYGVHKHASTATLQQFSRSYSRLIDECKSSVVSAKNAASQGDAGTEMQRK